MSLRSHLVRRVAQRNPSLGEVVVSQMFDIFFSAIIGCIKDDGRVELRGFGSFSTRNYTLKADTDSRLTKVQYRKVYFRPSSRLVKLVNDNK